MAVLKKLENKIKLVLIVSSLFLAGCIVISLGSIFTARGMVADAHKKIYVLDGTVPVLVKQTTMALHELYGKEARYCSNRKEAKDHGDVGILLGSPLKDGDRVVMVEDVTTSGKSIEETYPIITSQADIEVKGLMVSLNRMEVGRGGTMAALDEVRERYGFPTAAIVDMEEVTAHLHGRKVRGRVVIDDGIKAALDAYYERYGAVKEA